MRVPMIACCVLVIVIRLGKTADPRDLCLNDHGNEDAARFWDETFFNLGSLDLRLDSDCEYDLIDGGCTRYDHTPSCTNNEYMVPTQCTSLWPLSRVDDWSGHTQIFHTAQAETRGDTDNRYTEWQPPDAEDDGPTFSAEETHTDNERASLSQTYNMDRRETAFTSRKPRTERTSEYWKNLKPPSLKRRLSKRYKELMGKLIGDETIRGRLRSRCDANIEADLLAGDIISGNRAVRNLDFRNGVEKVFCETEKLRLRRVMEKQLHVDPHQATTMLSFGIAALPKKLKEYYGAYGIEDDDESYLEIAKELKTRYDERHRIEACVHGRQAYLQNVVSKQ